ncbi:MAG: family 43 glycosylhydrolase, partial [Verrucomicrobia bacterium]|nr:family 43 glycosylhydrolase [Verrucomicrobiota bacterium]
MNPILPLQHFVPDPEARVWEDGRVYFYGSYDFSGDLAFCSTQYRVFSSADLVEWTDHGVSFRAEDAYPEEACPGVPLCAPDCVYKDGLYYMYFCLADQSEGVASSELPYGPFKNAVPVEGAHGDGIDPAVLVDDDGQAYYYWGQFRCRAARLLPNMSALDMATRVDNLIDEASHGFHEGASMRKRNGVYYLIYSDISRGKPTCLSYATSRSPLGPFKKGGVIIDNADCDVASWNNHGSIVEFKGQWYVFYHRSSQASACSRRACV